MPACQVAQFCIYQVWPSQQAPLRRGKCLTGLLFLVEEIGLSECIHRVERQITAPVRKTSKTVKEEIVRS